MENQDLEVGKTYNVVHKRKGTFKMELIYHDETWAIGIITEGKAKAILDYNVINVR